MSRNNPGKLLTILVPTFNRAQKLRRFLSYLLKVEVHKKNVLNNIEFLIADGSEATDYKNNQIIGQLRQLGMHIEYCHFPRVDLIERFVLISKEIETNHVLVCGDDDLVDFEGVRDWLDNKDKFPVDYTYAGRFSNILGLSVFGLVVSCMERPFYGLKLTSEDPEIRLLMYGTANSFGITSLSYAIQPTSLFRDFWSIVEGQQLYLGGVEFLHQIFLSIRSKIIFSEKTLIFRDFSYIGYKSEKMREAPATDKYPYYGDKVVNLAVQIISDYSSADASRALEIIENVIDIQTSVLPSRLRLQGMYANQGSKICSCSDSISTAAIKSVWFRTYLEVYPRKLAIKKFIIFSLPASMTTFYKKIKSFF